MSKRKLTTEKRLKRMEEFMQNLCRHYGSTHVKISETKFFQECKTCGYSGYRYVPPVYKGKRR